MKAEAHSTKYLQIEYDPLTKGHISITGEPGLIQIIGMVMQQLHRAFVTLGVAKFLHFVNRNIPCLHHPLLKDVVVGSKRSIRNLRLKLLFELRVMNC